MRHRDNGIGLYNHLTIMGTNRAKKAARYKEPNTFIRIRMNAENCQQNESTGTHTASNSGPKYPFTVYAKTLKTRNIHKHMLLPLLHTQVIHLPQTSSRNTMLHNSCSLTVLKNLYGDQQRSRWSLFTWYAQHQHQDEKDWYEGSQVFIVLD